MKLTIEEKADRYDALAYAVGVTKESYERRLKEIETDLAQPTSENVYALLTGRKYAYMEIIESLEKVGEENV